MIILSEEQMRERNAHLMNTVPGTRIILSHTYGHPDLWAGSNILVGYDGHFPGQGFFRLVHPKALSGLGVYEEDSNWDFEVQGA